MNPKDDLDRRVYRRVQAPVFSRPVGALFQKDMRAVLDISLGGLRVYSDEIHELGNRLEMDLLLPSGDTVTITTTVVWVDELPPGGVAKFDVGLRFIDVTPADYKRLGEILGKPGE